MTSIDLGFEKMMVSILRNSLSELANVPEQEKWDLDRESWSLNLRCCKVCMEKITTILKQIKINTKNIDNMNTKLI